ncbi:MAG TPA: BamA/TamA family outer membrane protein [Vicinamibacterales bacterium]|nr:BamA/TamA family outer membrane protein [Vicinamibacterales bacterium]
MRQISRQCPVALLTILLSFWTMPADAQYFGRNKVQYKEFKFEVLKTEHFDIYFYEEEREGAARVGRMAERWYARLSQVFNHEMRTRQPLVLYASHPDFEQTNVVGGMIGEGTGGVTEGLKRRVVLPLAGTLQETDHVLGHELVHAFQYDISALRAAAGSGGGIETLPLWFVEGLAEYLSIGPVDAHTAMWLRDATREEKLPEIKDLDSGEFFPYRWGQAVWAYVGGKYGDALIEQIYRDALRSGPLLALKQATAIEEKDLSANWHADIRQQYAPVMAATGRAHTFGRSLTGSDKTRNATNVSPSISPDGRSIVFFSSRDLFSIDLYLAETATGKILRKLVDTAQNQHFTSLQFISSAGSWSPDSKQFVVGGIHAGKAVLALLNVQNGDVTREIELPDVGEVLNPTWSPDGKSIAFSATVGGDSDLFIYNLEASTVRRVTSDLFADLQPAWSPDGSQIAFVTDRFTTQADTLHAGDYRLALFDVASGRMTALPTFAPGKNINPQWNPDGRRLYFVSNHTGVSNVYSVEVHTGALTQITNVDSGVSGITALSPAISAGIDSRTLAISAYEEGAHHIYVIETAQQLAGKPVTSPSPVARLQAASLPPVEREATIARILNDPATGLPASTGEVAPYKAGLTLDGVSQPYISAGISQFGGAVGGGIAFSFSDMLGNHNLYTQISADTYGGGVGDLAKNTGVLVAYTNMKKRLNWGVMVEQSPYIAGGYAIGQAVVAGENALIDQTIIQRQVNQGISGMLAYPFSQNARMEFGGGFTRTSYDQQVRTIASSLRTGRILSDETRSAPLADSMNLTNVSTALVTDSSLFGPTSPVGGGRSRFEVSPTFGDLRLTTALVDYRRYFMPARFYTIAVRGLHYGRYGTGSQDSRLMPLFIGYPEFVRGYGINSFEPGECTSSTDCPTFDRLSGSRLMVANLELRFPLLRPFGVGQNMYGPLPVEVAFFLDGGVTWNKGQKPSFFNGTRKPVSSGGISLRTNLMGFAVAQIDYARPFDRQGRGWIWGFSLTPGF